MKVFSMCSESFAPETSSRDDFIFHASSASADQLCDRTTIWLPGKSEKNKIKVELY